MAGQQQGTCHICGQVGPLSFEHVPPKSAFNDRKIWVARGDQLFQGKAPGDLRAREQQGGGGEYTLCASCNNATGAWYVSAYADWATQAMEILERSGSPPTLAYRFTIYPLRVIKQVVAMFFSVNSPEFRKEVPYLEKLVLDRRAQGLPGDIRIYAAYTTGTHSRAAGKYGLMAESHGNHQAYALSELAFPPFVFVMALASPRPDARLTDISTFASYHYADKVPLYINFPVLPISTAYPTDYRTQAEIDAVNAMGGD